MTDSSPDAHTADHADTEHGRRRVDAYTSDRVTHVRPSASIREAAGILHAADVSLAVVSDESGIHGVVSERDVSRAVSAGLDVDTGTVADVETDDVIWMPPSSSVDDVAEVMTENYVRHVLIGDGLDEPVGVVSMRDLLVAYLV